MLSVILSHLIHFIPPLISKASLPSQRMNGSVSGAILCLSRRSGVCAASHWSSKWAGNGAGGHGCEGGGGWHWADQLGIMDQTPTRETGLTSNMAQTHGCQGEIIGADISLCTSHLLWHIHSAFSPCCPLSLDPSSCAALTFTSSILPLDLNLFLSFLFLYPL